MTTAWKNVIRGVAIGDSWGAGNEFRKIDTLIKDNPMGPALPEVLEVTDDTQMSLYLASALDDTWGAPVSEVKKAIIDAYLTYAVDPDNNRAPGVTVMSSLSQLATTKNWQTATSTTSDGSGTVMRTTPTAFLPEDRWVGATAFAAAVTHGTANGIAAAILNVAVLRDILAGKVQAGGLLARAFTFAEDPERFGLTETGDWLDGYHVDLLAGFAYLRELIVTVQEALPRLQADPWHRDSDPSLALDNGGWRSPHTLTIALLSVDMLPDDLWLGLRRSVTTDGDSDTVGAVTGGLVGALLNQQRVEPTPVEAWEELRDRFEPRYVRWIENEADFYPFEAPRRSWFRRLVSR